MKKNKKFYIGLGILGALIVGIIFAILYFLNNRANSFTFGERSYINANQNNVIDVSVEGSLPLYSTNGSGVFYDFIKALEKETKLTFNVALNGNGSYNFSNKNIIGENDLVFYTDHYVVISSLSNRISDINELKDQPIGVIKTDKDYVANYIPSIESQLASYSNIYELTEDMNNTIVYAVVPLQKYMNAIINNKYNIVYHIEGLHSHYVLTLSDKTTTLSSIFTKYFNRWKDNTRSSFSSAFLDLYYNSNNISELEKETITSDDLIVGYIDNMPLEGKIYGTFSGLTNEYLDLFSKMTGATYKYIKYNSIDQAIEGLNNNKVDIMMNYYNISNSNYAGTSYLGNIEYVLVTSNTNSTQINGIKSIEGTVKTIASTALTSYLKTLNINVETYSSYKELIKSLDKDDIIVMEKYVYDFYKNKELKDYVIKFIDESTTNNNFLLQRNKIVLSNLFSFYVSTLGVNEVSSLAATNSIANINRNVIIEFIVNNILYILILTIAITFFMVKFRRKIKITKKIRKEDKMLYLDVMTNLKNRNYLNDNLVYWEANKVYPQTIVIVDLNNIAQINDAKGHEEGDKQIKAAARILINTQRENSEIVRTNGNEFLIYLVGYDEKQILTYVNKLVKELKNLPYNYGASLGYHMIVSESTTIDDAINEALIMMRKNKEDKHEG